MIIFGKDERIKFEDIRGTLSDAVCRQYDEAKTYRDGKWVMFEPTNTADFDDENTIILRVELTDGLLLSHGTRYEF